MNGNPLLRPQKTHQMKKKKQTFQLNLDTKTFIYFRDDNNRAAERQGY